MNGDYVAQVVAHAERLEASLPVMYVALRGPGGLNLLGVFHHEKDAQEACEAFSKVTLHWSRNESGDLISQGVRMKETRDRARYFVIQREVK